MPLTDTPFAHSPLIEKVRETLNQNVTTPERVASVAAGASLVVYGTSRRSIPGLLIAVVGGLLIRRGAKGHCELYQKLGINSAQLNSEHGVPGNKGIKVEKSVTINRPAAEVYRFWRNLENLPRFMEHVESVKEIDAKRSHWVVKAPLGSHVEWTSQTVTDHPNEFISWESLPGADVQNAGSVRFDTNGDPSSTKVTVKLQYNPPAGVVGATIAKFFGEAPDQQLEADLGRLKNLVESEEIVTTSAMAPEPVAHVG